MRRMLFLVILASATAYSIAVADISLVEESYFYRSAPKIDQLQQSEEKEFSISYQNLALRSEHQSVIGSPRIPNLIDGRLADSANPKCDSDLRLNCFASVRKAIVVGKNVDLAAPDVLNKLLREIKKGTTSEQLETVPVIEIEIHADTVRVSGSVALPQRNVSIYAQRLKFENSGSSIDLSAYSDPREYLYDIKGELCDPVSQNNKCNDVSKEFEGADGQNGGNLVLAVNEIFVPKQQVSPQSSTARIVSNGGNGFSGTNGSLGVNAIAFPPSASLGPLLEIANPAVEQMWNRMCKGDKDLPSVKKAIANRQISIEIAGRSKGNYSANQSIAWKKTSSWGAGIAFRTAWQIASGYSERGGDAKANGAPGRAGRAGNIIIPEDFVIVEVEGANDGMERAIDGSEASVRLGNEISLSGGSPGKWHVTNGGGQVIQSGTGVSDIPGGEAPPQTYVLVLRTLVSDDSRCELYPLLVPTPGNSVRTQIKSEVPGTNGTVTARSLSPISVEYIDRQFEYANSYYRSGAPSEALVRFKEIQDLLSDTNGYSKLHELSSIAVSVDSKISALKMGLDYFGHEPGWVPEFDLYTLTGKLGENIGNDLALWARITTILRGANESEAAFDSAVRGINEYDAEAIKDRILDNAQVVQLNHRLQALNGKQQVLENHIKLKSAELLSRAESLARGELKDKNRDLLGQVIQVANLVPAFQPYAAGAQAIYSASRKKGTKDLGQVIADYKKATSNAATSGPCQNPDVSEVTKKVHEAQRVANELAIRNVPKLDEKTATAVDSAICTIDEFNRIVAAPRVDGDELADLARIKYEELFKSDADARLFSDNLRQLLREKELLVQDLAAEANRKAAAILELEALTRAQERLAIELTDSRQLDRSNVTVLERLEKTLRFRIDSRLYEIERAYEYSNLSPAPFDYRGFLDFALQKVSLPDTQSYELLLNSANDYLQSEITRNPELTTQGRFNRLDFSILLSDQAASALLSSGETVFSPSKYFSSDLTKRVFIEEIYVDGLLASESESLKEAHGVRFDIFVEKVRSRDVSSGSAENSFLVWRIENTQRKSLSAAEWYYTSVAKRAEYAASCASDDYVGCAFHSEEINKDQKSCATLLCLPAQVDAQSQFRIRASKLGDYEIPPAGAIKQVVLKGTKIEVGI